MTELDRDRYREVIGAFATGVTVMTTTHDGEPHAMTANAISSVSLDPLLVLVCVDRGTIMLDMVERSGVFALSILTAAQADLSARFADPDRPVGAPMFAGVDTTTDVTGAPILRSALGHVDCEVWASYDGGDHVIVVGQVVGMARGEPADPLLYFRSAYTTTRPEA